MPLDAIALLAAGAVFHAAWNLLAKTSRRPTAFLWVALTAAVLLLAAPLLAGVRAGAVRLPAGPGLGLAALVGALETLYFYLLGSAYAAGDLSTIYPVARGTAPVFTAGLAAVALGERPTAPGAAGIAVVAVGILLLHAGHAEAGTPAGGPRAVLRAATRGPSLLALATGLVIASYSVADKAALAYASPFGLLWTVFVFAWAGLTAVLWPRRAEIRAEWRQNGRRAAAVGLLFCASYWAALTVLSHHPAGYVAAVRELSIVVAAAAGVWLLREPAGVYRLAGAGVVFLGVALIGLAR